MLNGSYPFSEEFKSRYSVTGLLGDGAFGFVLLGIRMIEDRCVAVKFIYKRRVISQDTVSMNACAARTAGFETSCIDEHACKEVSIMKQLSHPNIIQYYDSYTDDKYIYLVMELFGTSWEHNNPLLTKDTHPGLREMECKKPPGNSLLTFQPKYYELDDLIECSECQENPLSATMIEYHARCDLFDCIDAHEYLPEDIIHSIFCQVYKAVCYLSDQGIFHRDIKDENILIDELYQVKITDFGSAALIDDHNGYFDRFRGTMQFAPPEVTLGIPYLASACEVWNLGILLYTLIFRCSPFHESDHIERHCDLTLHFPNHLCESVHSNIKNELNGRWNLTCKMLEIDPKIRIPLKSISLHPWMALSIGTIRISQHQVL